jgi:integrase/recombinase XerC
LLREKVVRDNPGLDVRAPKSKRRLPRTLDADQMGKLLDFPGDDPLAVRDRAFMELLYSSGYVWRNFADLRSVDLDLGDRTVRVTGKGGKTRILPVGSRALEALRAWLAVRATYAPAAGAALFVGREGRPVGATHDSGPRGASRPRTRPADARPPAPLPPLLCDRICSSRAKICAAYKNCSVMPTSRTTQVYTHLDFQHLARIYDRIPHSRRANAEDRAA